MLAFVAVALAAPAAHAAPDPVVRAINAGVMSRQITPAQGRELRSTWWASARAARTARTWNRRANIVAVRTYTMNLARARGLTGPRLLPVLLSVKATTHVMLKDSYPRHEEELSIPGEVAVFTYYARRGVQLQPFETFKQGLRELNTRTPDIEAARAIADRMLELDVPRGSSTTWEYYFPFGGPSRPWSSAISQAIATEFYYRVAGMVPEAERAPYDTAAAQANRAFLRSTRFGGVASPQGTGRFYVMYSFAPSQRILNGHLQALLNVNRYANATGSKEARLAVDLGLRGVLEMLPKFDTGAWSNYQPGQEAELGYHQFQTDQLVKLGAETANPMLEEYAARFAKYLETPPRLAIVGAGWPSIIPAPDGFRDKATIRFGVDKRSRVTMVVSDLTGREVRRVSWWGRRGRGVLTWNGRMANGTTAPDGEYRVTFTSTDVAGNRSFTELPGPLKVERDTVPPELRLLTLRAVAGKGVVTVSAVDHGSAWVVASVRIGGKIVASRRGPRSGSVTLRTGRPLAQVRKGQLLLRDSSGNELVYDL